MNTSLPRTESIISTITSPSLNRPDHQLAKRQLEPVGDLLGKFHIGIAGEHQEPVVVSIGGVWVCSTPLSH